MITDPFVELAEDFADEFRSADKTPKSIRKRKALAIEKIENTQNITFKIGEISYSYDSIISFIHRPVKYEEEELGFFKFCINIGTETEDVFFFYTSDYDVQEYAIEGAIRNILSKRKVADENPINDSENIVYIDSIPEEINKLKKLLDIGALTEEEYNSQKKELLELPTYTEIVTETETTPPKIEAEETNNNIIVENEKIAYTPDEQQSQTGVYADKQEELPSYEEKNEKKTIFDQLKKVSKEIWRAGR